MNFVKNHMVILFSIVGILLTANVFADNNHKWLTCEGTYALCTSAPCIPDPNDPKKTAICQCDVEQGKNIGLSSCDDRQAKTKHNIQAILSTYSFEQASSKKVMSCPAGNPWTDCMDQSCIVDPANPSKAICSCKIEHSGAFVTYGGGCDKNTCATGYWSGASKAGFEQASSALMQTLQLQSIPAQYCSE